MTAGACAQDPEGILATPRGGHISRQQTRKNMQENLELQKQYDAAKEEAAEELRQKREVLAGPAAPLSAWSEPEAAEVTAGRLHRGSLWQPAAPPHLVR